MKNLAGLLLLLVVAVSTGAASVNSRPLPILVVGDSISAAYGMATESGWVHLLQQRIDRSKLDYRVINASVSGDTSANALQRMQRRLVEVKPLVVVIEIGGNDGLRALPLTTLEKNLEALISESRSHGARVLLLGIDLPPNYGQDYILRFKQVYQRVAERMQVSLVASILEGIGGNPDLMQSDGIHPNADAQEKILDHVWPLLREILSDSYPVSGSA